MKEPSIAIRVYLTSDGSDEGEVFEIEVSSQTEGDEISSDEELLERAQIALINICDDGFGL